VRADAEGQMLTRRSPDIEVLRVGAEPVVVAVGRADQRQHRAARRNGLPVVVDIAGDVARCLQRRRLIPQDLFDGLGQQ
jgi:hypothetical protein